MEFFQVHEHPHHLQVHFLARESSNALSLAGARELAGLVRSYRNWEKPVVVVSDHPRFFCSGGNLTAYKKLKSKAAGFKVNCEIASCLERFRKWPVVKLAVVEGDALGGGLEWLSAFNFRWSTPEALFSFWQRRIGLSPGWGGGAAWAELLGEDRLRRVMSEALLLHAGEAKFLGLVDKVVTGWSIREAAGQWARHMDHPSVRQLAKWRARDELRIFASLWMSEAHSAALERW